MQRLVQLRPEPREIEGDRFDVTDLELTQPNVRELRRVESGGLTPLTSRLPGRSSLTRRPSSRASVRSTTDGAAALFEQAGKRSTTSPTLIPTTTWFATRSNETAIPVTLKMSD